ncbi:MAG TPA: EamA family transporter [Kofleriaceae bacterium]|nr:EamA family transporter [Kofleriaceae bacterium]
MKSRTLLISLAAVYVIWGSTYLAMQIAIGGLPPLAMACVRFIAAGGILLAVARHRGAQIPPLRDWLRVAPVGALLFLGGNGFVALAEQSVSSGGVAVVCATMPLWVGVLGAAIGVRPTGREWFALLLGFVGVVVLMGGPSLTGQHAHIAFAIGSPILWATGSLLSRRTKDVGGAHAALVGPAVQMLTGAGALAIAAMLHGEHLPAHVPISSLLAVAYLIVFGSIVGFTAYAWLLRNARPVVATSYAYVNPVLAVLIGAALHGEQLGWSTLAANVLIISAIGLALTRRVR